MAHDKVTGILITYNDLYGDDPDKIIKKLSNYYPSTLWRVSSYINSLLFSERLNKQKQQIQFLENNLRTRNCDCFKRLMRKGHEIEIQGKYWILFNRSSMLGVFKILIEKMNNTTLMGDTPEEFDELFLKLVLIANQERFKYEAVKKSVLNNTNQTFSQLRYIWPLKFAQVDNEDKIHIVYQSIRCLLLLNFMINNAPDQFKSFQDSFGFKGEYDYLEKIISPITICNVMKKKECTYSFKREEDSCKFYDSLCINKQNNTDFEISDIKFYPLFEYQGNYIVTDWSYFGNQFYQGLWTQFRRFGVTNKSKLGLFFERNLMKKLFQYIFRNADSLIFDTEESIGIEDCYVRIGRKILLFEFKDILFPEDVIESFDFDTIKEKVDEGMILSKNGRKKALTQLCDNIETVYNGYYKSNDWGKTKLNSKSLEIYPVVLYTDDKFRVNGVNYYLNKRFNSMVEGKMNDWKNKCNIYRAQINNLTIIGLEFMINNMVTLHKHPDMFSDMINQYHFHSKITHNTTNNDLMTRLESFESIFYKMDYVVPKDKMEILKILKDCDLI